LSYFLQPIFLHRHVEWGKNELPASSVRYTLKTFLDFHFNLTKLLSYFNPYCFFFSVTYYWKIVKSNLTFLPSYSLAYCVGMPLESENSVPHRWHVYFQVHLAAKESKPVALHFPSIGFTRTL
jgi:hypothetical protein